MAIEAFPLQWPLGRQRTSSYSRKRAAFKTSPGKARDELLYQLKKLGAKDVVISSNIATYQRAGQSIMYADQRAASEDPGVAVYYTWNGDQYSLACDKWDKWVDNLHSLNKTVEAIRGIERWGTGEMVKAAFAGFKSLPEPPKQTKRPWWEVLGVNKNAWQSQIREAYIRKVKETHPDAGGTTQAFQEVAQAFEEATKR